MSTTGFKNTLRRTWPVLLSYGIFSIWGVTCLFASVALTSGGLGVSPGAIGGVIGTVAATAIGHVLGNVLGLFGFRLSPVTVLFFALFIGATLTGAVIGSFAIFLVIGVFAALGGYLGIASRLDVVAAWYPLAFAIGGAIHWMNHHRGLSTFSSGQKHALWDPFTIICLAGAVFLMLVFLATRHSLGLTVWQEVSRPPGIEGDRIGVARPGRGSILVLFLFTILVLGSTAIISPYLFRTHADNQGQEGDAKEEAKDPDTQKGENEGKAGKSKKKKKQKKKKKKRKQAGGGGGGGAGGQGDSQGEAEADGGAGDGGASDGDDGEDGEDGDDEPDTDQAREAAAEALNLGFKIFLGILAAILAIVFFLVGVLPPFRRAFLLRHLERSLWPVPPTGRVMNLWRRALATLEVAGIESASGETPRDFATRAEAEVRSVLGCASPGLHEAAVIVERVDYAGRGLGSGDEAAMRAAVTTFLRTVEPHLGTKRKLAAAWSRTPEVES